MTKHSQKGFLFVSYFSQELELIGDPFKRSRGIGFKVNANICSLEEEYGNPSEKNLHLPGFRAACKAQSDFRAEAII